MEMQLTTPPARSGAGGGFNLRWKTFSTQEKEFFGIPEELTA